MATGIAPVCLLAYLCTICPQDASAKLRMTPNNTAGVVGTSVVLQCQGSVDVPFGGILWNEFISSTTSFSSLTLNSDLAPNAPNPQLYSITGDSSVAQYHLIIELAFLSGGRYQCLEPIDGFSGFAHVTVLESTPVCRDTIQADGVVEEGETITYTCEVVYNSTSIDWPPVMTWTRPDGTIAGVNKLSTSGGIVNNSVDVTGAPGLNGTVYSVQTHFEAYGEQPSLPPRHAKNEPTYSHTHSFTALQVHYSPGYIAFQPDGNTFNPSDRLTCSAAGNPTVSYKWYKSTDNSTLADGPELTIREEMDGLTCGCEAYNTIRGIKRSVNKEVTLTVTKATMTSTSSTSSTTDTYTTYPTGGQCSGSSPGVVAGIVIAVLLLLGILFVPSLLLWRKRNTPCEKCKQKLNQQHPTNSNSSHGVYETPNPSGMTTQPSEYAELSFQVA